MNTLPTPPYRGGELTSPHPLEDRARPILRRARSLSLGPNGRIDEKDFLIPVMPLFEGAFTAFARGALVDTTDGPVAIEDLLPGDRVLTVDGDPMPVLWIGATTVQARNIPGQPKPLPIYRIASEAFGVGRPIAHLVTGPSARLRRTPGHMRTQAMNQPVLTPVAVFEDGVTITRTTPPSAVELFHFCLPHHAVVRISGLEAETYHPGHGAAGEVGPALRKLFFEMFPHIEDA
ncbi:MAG: hypothetical protein EP307_04420, partial [Rhodobacteraceae bacterium]